MADPVAPTTTVFLTRHGESEHNLNTEVFMGRAPDSALTEKGREQARRLARRLAARPGAPLERIIHSSLPRARETAEIIGEALGVGALHAEDAFWELSKGDWEGVMPRVPPPQVTRAIEAGPFDFRYGGAESYRDVAARCTPAWDGWVARFRGGVLLFVLHGDVTRALLQHLLGFPEGKINDFSVDPCSLTELTERGGRYHLVRFNDAAHLE